MKKPESILALSELPYATVHALACSSNAIAARHIHPVRRWPWSRNYVPGLMTCDLCNRNWVAPTETPAHADYCPVGRTQEVAQKIIQLGSQPHLQPRIVEPLLRLEDHPLPGEEKCGAEFGIRGHELPCTLKKGHPAIRNTFGHWNPSIGEMFFLYQSHERSDGSAEAVRPGGDPAAHALAPAQEYAEPWAWDPKLCVVVDKNGNTVANMILTDLSVMEQEEYGLRIAVCVNFCREMPSEELRKIDRIMSESIVEALAQDREEIAAPTSEMIQ